MNSKYCGFLLSLLQSLAFFIFSYFPLFTLDFIGSQPRQCIQNSNDNECYHEYQHFNKSTNVLPCHHSCLHTLVYFSCIVVKCANELILFTVHVLYFRQVVAQMYEFASQVPTIPKKLSNLFLIYLHRCGKAAVI